jgi:MFS family permease
VDPGGGSIDPFEGSGRLLRRNVVFRRFWFGRVASHLGDGAAAIAIVLYVQELKGTGVAVGAILLAAGLPKLLGPVAGSLADRVDQRRLLIACDLAQAVLFGLAAAWVPPFAALVVVVALASVADTAFAPAGRSSLPVFVGAPDLPTANAWTGMALNLQVVLGPVIGAALFAVGGLRWALAVDAASFVVSALFLRTLPPLRPASAPEHGLLGGAWAGLRDGMRNRVVRAVVLTLFLGVALAAMDNVALVFLARDLGAGDLGFGVLTAVFGVGMLLASVVLVRVAARVSAGRLLLAGWLASGTGSLGVGLSRVTAVAVPCQLLAGAGNGATNVADTTLIHHHVPRAMQARAFGLIGTAAFLGGSVASVAGGFLLDATSARTVFVVAGVGTLAVTVLAAAMLPKALLRRGPDAPDVAPPAP